MGESERVRERESERDCTCVRRQTARVRVWQQQQACVTLVQK